MIPKILFLKNKSKNFKKFLSGFSSVILMILLFSGVAFSQSEEKSLMAVFSEVTSPEKNNAQKSSSSDKEIIQSEITAIKNVTQDVLVANQEIKKVEAQIREEKKNLAVAQAQNAFGQDLLTDIAVREKAETIEKKEEAVASTQDFIKHKIEAYESITAIIEKKIRLMHEQGMSAPAFKNEQQHIDLEVRNFKKTQDKLRQNLDHKQREIESLKTTIETQNLLIGLKDSPAHHEALKAVKEQLNSTEIQRKNIEERLDLIALELRILKSYQEELRKSRWVYLKKSLSNQGKGAFELKDIATILFFLSLCLGLILNRRRLILSLTEHQYYGSKKIASSFIFLLFLSLASLLSYITLLFLGFHSLAYYLGMKFLMTLVILMGAIFVYKSVKASVRYFFYREKTKNTDDESKISHPYAELFLSLFWWLTIGIMMFLCMSLWDVNIESTDLFIKAFNYPLFNIGDEVVSLQSIFKVLFTIWVFVFASRLISNILSKTIYPRLRIDESIQYAISVVIKYLMFIMGVFVGFQMIGIRMTALTVFAGTIGIGIGFGLQDIAKNFISGLIILIERPIKIGDFVEVGNLPGKVQAINARSTVVNTFDNISVVVPNSDFMSQQVINWSYSDRIIRIPMSVGVAYGSDVDLVMKLLLEVAKKNDKVLKSPQPTVLFEEFGDSSLNFKLFAWTREPENRFLVKSQINAGIDATFRQHNITIPFPQRDLHFKSSEISFSESGKFESVKTTIASKESKNISKSGEAFKSQPNEAEVLEEIEKLKRKDEDNQKKQQGE